MYAAPATVLDALRATGPFPEYAAQMELYGRLVGEWDGRVTVLRRDGGRRTESCEVYFGWVLEGRAIQDVWIAPAGRDRTQPGRDASRDMYGTTLRAYVPQDDAWQIMWSDPGTASYRMMQGRAEGDDIVQEYRDEAGTLWQWRFTDITDTSFRWISQESDDDGASWSLRNEFLLQRRSCDATA
jgi:hypothetical protein